MNHDIDLISYLSERNLLPKCELLMASNNSGDSYIAKVEWRKNESWTKQINP